MSVCPCSCKQVRASLCMLGAPMDPKMAIFLSRMSVNTRFKCKISARTPRLQLTFLSRANWHSARARAITVSHTHTREWHVQSIHYNNNIMHIYTMYETGLSKNTGFPGTRGACFIGISCSHHSKGRMVTIVHINVPIYRTCCRDTVHFKWVQFRRI